MQDNGTSGGNIDSINSWPRIFGGDGFQPAFHPTDTSISYAETQRGNIWLLLNGGENFFYVSSFTEEEGERTNWDTPYMLSRFNPDRLYTGTQRAHRGIRNGFDVDWTPISGDLTDGNIFGSPFHTISALDESHFLQGRIYYGTTDGNVWRLENNGATENNISAGLPDRYVTDVKASPSVPDRVYVTHSGYKDNEFIPRVHRSDDAGENWIDISGDLPELAINDLYVLPNYEDGVLFAATDGGVYGTLNAGQNWQRLGTNMPYIPVYDLELNVAKNELIAGTFARSIMTYSIDSLLQGATVEPPDTTTMTGSTDIIIKRPNVKLYPSPATDYITAEFQVTEPGKPYELVVLDQTGKLMQRESTTPQGPVSQRLDISDYPAGIYYVKVKFRHTILSGSFTKL